MIAVRAGGKCQGNDQQEDIQQCRFIADNEVDDLLHAPVQLKIPPAFGRDRILRSALFDKNALVPLQIFQCDACATYHGP